MGSAVFTTNEMKQKWLEVLINTIKLQLLYNVQALLVKISRLPVSENLTSKDIPVNIYDLKLVGNPSRNESSISDHGLFCCIYFFKNVNCMVSIIDLINKYVYVV